MKSNKPVSGTKEWAKFSANMTIGCSHNCRYCYSREAYDKNDTSGIPWNEERIDEKALNKVWGKRSGTIMFPTTHDITKYNYKEATKFLENILAAGNDVLIVSKPELLCINYLTDNLEKYKNQILFRFTIGSIDNKVLNFWEPGSPNFEERLESLKTAFNKGFSTSISAEPLLDNTSAMTLVSTLEPYITDSIWIGKMNKPDKRIVEISKEDPWVLKYLENQKDENIIKIFNELKNNPKIKWKESIKKVVGIDIPTEAGLDI